MAFYLGIDSGTQSTKAIIVDQQGQVLGRGQAQHHMIEGLGVGHKEQDPANWISALKTAIKDAITKSGIDPKEIVAMGVSGQQHGFTPIDKDGNVIRPAKLWCDTATATEAEEIMANNGGIDSYIKLTGNSVPAGFTASKILWLKKNEPENFAKLATVLLPHDYLNFWLTGEKRMEYGDASGTALMDIRTRSWCGQAIMSIDDHLGDALPPIVHPGEIVGTVRPEVAEEFGFSPDAIVSAGGGDNMMGAIGTGNVAPGLVTISLGTSGTIYAYSNKPVIDTELGEIAAFCDSTGGWLPLICTMNVTVATGLVRRTLGMTTPELDAAAATIAPGCDGLMLLPYLEGERTPNVPDGSGVWLGYNEKTHTPAHFARAAMEGPTLGLAYGFSRLKEKGIAPKEIRLTGGGSNAGVWRQIIADVMNTPVVCTTESEGAALGGAIQARWALERKTNPDASIAALCEKYVKVDESTRCIPNPEAAKRYAQMLEIHNNLSQALRPVFKQHRAFVNKG